VQGINTQAVEEADVFALDEQAGQFCVEVFFFRNWQNWGNRAYFPKADKSMDPGRGAGLVHGAVLRRQAGAAPHPALARDRGCRADGRALSTAPRTGSRSMRPKRGERRQILDYALRNAKEALARRLADTASQQKLLVSLAQAFGCDRRRAASRSTTTRTSWARARSGP
jgi:excinuclease ABC subunit C